MERESTEILYRFFRTASDYLQGYRSTEPYPQSFVQLSTVDTVPAQPSPVVKAECLRNTVPAPDHAEKRTNCGDAIPAVENLTVAGGVPDKPLPKQFQTTFNSMQEVYAAVARCSACALARTRTNTVTGEGPEELSRLTNSVEVMVIGEGPGAEEDRQGRPFVGRAGVLLDKMLEAIQLSRKTNCYITNIVKCRPPQNRDPAPEERSACSDFLHAQIKLIKPKMILVMGRIACQHLLQTANGIGKLHGQFFDYHGIPLMPTYHPSALLRDERLKRPAWEDLKRFRARLPELRQ